MHGTHRHQEGAANGAIFTSSSLLPLLPRRLQLPVPFRVDLLLPPRQHVVARGTVQADVVVVVHITLYQTPRRTAARTYPDTFSARPSQGPDGSQAELSGPKGVSFAPSCLSRLAWWAGSGCASHSTPIQPRLTRGKTRVKAQYRRLPQWNLPNARLA